MYAAWYDECMETQTTQKNKRTGIQLLPEQHIALAELAKRTDRSEEELARDAVAGYLETEHWQIEAIKQGMADADAGIVVADADVKLWAERLGTADEIPVPRAPRPA